MNDDFKWRHFEPFLSQRQATMKIEKPCSPGHCLGMLNDNMRTDILRDVHQGIKARMDQRGKKSPLEILIESIEDVLATFEGSNLFERVGPNPFNSGPFYRFQPEPDYRHDIKLLKSQLGSLRELFASLDSF
jgi:hypothetical protein